MDKANIYILESQRAKAEQLINTGGASGINIMSLWHIAATEFHFPYPQEIALNAQHRIPELQKMLKELYEAYDELKSKEPV